MRTLSRVELLQRAKKLLQEWRSSYICVCVLVAAKEHSKEHGFEWSSQWCETETFAKAKQIEHDISKWLGGVSTYNEWVLLNHPRIAEKMSYDDMREARLQWMDAMIAYYRKENL